MTIFVRLSSVGLGLHDGVVPGADQVREGPRVSGKVLGEDAAGGDVLGPVAVGAAGPEQMELPGVFLGPGVVVLMAGVQVADLHPVQITGDGGGACPPVGVGLDQQPLH